MKAFNKKVVRLVTATLFALATPFASAVEVGLGVSLQNNGDSSGGYGVSLPLRFGNFTIEPELTFYDSSQDTTYPSSPTNNSTSDSQSYTLETGVYWRQPVIPSVEMYVGGRMGYVKNEYSVTHPLSPTNDYSYDTSGYFLGPTLGAEYFFNKNFSLGLDASLLYESTSGDNVYPASPGNNSKTDRNAINYQSRVRLRFYF